MSTFVSKEETQMAGCKLYMVWSLLGLRKTKDKPIAVSYLCHSKVATDSVHKINHHFANLMKIFYSEVNYSIQLALFTGLFTAYVDRCIQLLLQGPVQSSDHLQTL